MKRLLLILSPYILVCLIFSGTLFLTTKLEQKETPVKNQTDSLATDTIR
jgi:hypothetical protein